MFFIFLFTLLQLQTFETADEFFVLIKSDKNNLTFSSYRLNNPERIVLEINGSIPTDDLETALNVKSVKIYETGNITRFIFKTKRNTQYTVLNRNNALLIGFSSTVFLDSENFEKTLAQIKIKSKTIREKQQKKTLLAKNTPKKIKIKKTDESKLVGNFLDDLKNDEIKATVEKNRLKEEQRIAKLKIIEEEKRIALLKRKEKLKRIEIEKKKQEELKVAKLKKAAELKRVELEKETIITKNVAGYLSGAHPELRKETVILSIYQALL